MSEETSDDALREIISDIVLDAGKTRYISFGERQRLKKRLFNAVRRLDVLQDLIDDPEISEIMVNGTEAIFIEKAGRITEYEERFVSEDKLSDVVQKIAADSNRIVNEASPIVDCRLDNGSRVNMVLPPVSLVGPVITIRKFPDKVMTMERLIELNSVSREAADQLSKLVRAGYNIFVSGGTGSGKTSFLNALSHYISETERVITIEDSAELQLKSIKNLVRLEVRNANVEGKNAVTIRDLIKASLRMRPDRILVGEVRDEAAIDMLQALNTGHSGMSTGHSNSPADMLSRIETMVLLGADIPLPAVRRQIASAIDIIIHLGRFRDRSRRVVEIDEVAGYENGEIILNPLYRFREEDESDGQIHGILERTENSLLHREKLVAAGISSSTE